MQAHQHPSPRLYQFSSTLPEAWVGMLRGAGWLLILEWQCPEDMRPQGLPLASGWLPHGMGGERRPAHRAVSGLSPSAVRSCSTARQVCWGSWQPSAGNQHPLLCWFEKHPFSEYPSSLPARFPPKRAGSIATRKCNLLQVDFSALFTDPSPYGPFEGEKRILEGGCKWKTIEGS